MSVGVVKQDHLNTWVMNLYNTIVTARGAEGINKSGGVETVNWVVTVTSYFNSRVAASYCKTKHFIIIFIILIGRLK